MRVLVVDDEPDARELIRRLLDRCDAEVTAAASARRGPRAADGATARDVLVSDIGMPDEDGYELIRQRPRRWRPTRRRRPRRRPDRLRPRRGPHARASRAGFQTHLAKPVEPAELIAVVADLAAKGSNGSA